MKEANQGAWRCLGLGCIPALSNSLAHRFLQLVCPTCQDVVAGGQRTPLHRVRTQLRVKHLQTAGP